ncbi:hypothetical protein PI125_g10570 [Phytophthora idaei]|nr:hypothetical protein PI125_g10570 [Phytophthora idaei]KAG3151588.1 hypothetical protein PI126_g10918 [Phytophthora idaei]
MKIPKDMVIDNPPAEDTDDEDISPGMIPQGMKRMIDHMYTDVNKSEIATDEYFANRTILTTTNAIVHRINEAVAARLPDTTHEYLSSDSVEDDIDGSLFEQVVLHSVECVLSYMQHRLPN